MKIYSNIFPVVIHEVEKTSEIFMGKSNRKKSFGQELAERQKENEEAERAKANAASSENYANNANLASLVYQSKLASLQKKPEEKLNIKARGGLYEK